MDNRTSRLPRRALVTALVALAHLPVLLFLGRKVPGLVVTERGNDGPVITLTLASPEIRLRTRLAEAPARPARPAPAPPARILAAPAAQAPLTNAPAQPAPVPPNIETTPDGDLVRKALRGLVGCASATTYHLSRSEQAACDQRLAAARPAPVGQPFSPEELKQFNSDKQESILTRKPTNECLPRLGDHPPIKEGGSRGLSSSATTAVGIGCGWSF